MYYSAATAEDPRKHCIGAAISATVAGPFTPFNVTIACDLAAGGAIDPDLFHDPQYDAYYLLYKVDGNSIGSGGTCGNSNDPKTPTPIALQQLSSDLTIPTGNPVYLFSNGVSDLGSNVIVNYPDGPNVEGPALFFHDGTYYLAYNSGCFAEESYEVKYLVCEGAPALYACGRWSDGQSDESVLLKTGSSPSLFAPGSMDVVVGENATRIVFHGDINVDWFADQSQERVRGMFALELAYENATLLQVTSLSVRGLSNIPLLSVSYCVVLVVAVVTHLAIF